MRENQRKGEIEIVREKEARESKGGKVREDEKM